MLSAPAYQIGASSLDSDCGMVLSPFTIALGSGACLFETRTLWNFFWACVYARTFRPSLVGPFARPMCHSPMPITIKARREGFHERDSCGEIDV